MRVKSILVCAVAVGLATAVQAARFEAGKGVANDRATGAGPSRLWRGAARMHMGTGSGGNM